MLVRYTMKKQKIPEKLYEVTFTWFAGVNLFENTYKLDLGIRKEKFYVPAHHTNVAIIESTIKKIWPNYRDLKIKIIKE